MKLTVNTQLLESLTIIFLLTVFLTSCKFGELINRPLPEGFENVSHDGNSYFVYVDKEYWGDKVKQLGVGRQLCRDVYAKNSYCEVYYFAEKKDIPTEFPIVNRMNALGVYEMKYGSRKLRMLSGDQSNKGNVTFMKNQENSTPIFKSVKDNKDK